MSISGIGNSSGLSTSQMASEIFKKMDANGDGGIDKAELKAALAKKSGQGPDAAKVDKIFAAADANGDGKIDASENETQVKKMAATGGKPPAKGSAPAGEGKADPAAAVSAGESTKTYDKRDLNQDGKVTYQDEVKYDLQHPNTQYTAQGKTEDQTAATKSTVNIIA